jgi:hypothetical protein
MGAHPASNEAAMGPPGAVEAGLRAPLAWSPATRVAFRWSLVYFGVYVLVTQMLGSLVPFVDAEEWGIWTLPRFQAVVFWVGRHVFSVLSPMVVMGSGSGDKTFDWVLNFCILVVAIVAAAVWSVLDCKRREYNKLYAWFRLFMRFSLAATMLTYGMMKAVPLQMPAPALTRLLEPYGNFSPMGVLWSFVGSSSAYEVAVGCAELAGGIFLFLPRTTTFGALICLADAIQIFLMNMTYDVPVKLFSFNLIAFSLFLLAPEVRRLANVFFLNRATAPATEAPLLRGGRARRIALALQIVFGICLLGSNLYFALQADKMFGAARPKSPLYGIWTVQDFSVDGQPHPPLLTDSARWRRVIFDFPQFVTVESMAGTNTFYGASIRMDSKTLALTKRGDKNWKASFSFQQTSPNQLLLEGTADNHKIQARLSLFDRSKFLLVNRGFHWVQEYPLNH